MKSLNPAPGLVSTHLVKLGDQGLLTIALPEMAGRYLVVEQRAGRVVISPMDLEASPYGASIAQHAGGTTLLVTAANVPTA
jgi:hypothetical protein